MSPDPAPPAPPPGTPADKPSAAGRGPQWDRDGTDLARSFLARAQGSAVAGRAGALRGASRARTGWSAPRRGPSTGSSGATSNGLGSSAAGWSGSRADDRDPQPLEAALSRLVAEYGWAPELKVHGVVARWAEIVGPQLAEHAQPEDFEPGEQGGTLTVRCNSTAWATQLRLMAPSLVRRLNEEVGANSVAKVVILGPAAPTWARGHRRVPGRGPRDTYG